MAPGTGTASTRVLIVEDSDTQATELAELLGGAGLATRRARTLAEAVEAAGDGSFDAILLDLGLPDLSGLDVFRRMRAAAPRTAIVVLTHLDDERVALQAVQEGAQDYLLKGEAGAGLLVRSIRYAIERHHAEQILARSRDDLLAVLNLLRIGTVLTDGEGRVTFHSRTADPFVRPGGPATEGRHWTEALVLADDDRAALEALLATPAPDRRRQRVEIQTAGGRRHTVEVEVFDDPRGAGRKLFCLYDVSEVEHLRRRLSDRARFHELIGRSEAMEAVFQLIRDVAPVDATVLIEGETGTGKELVARAIHASSPRREGPFVAVNCAGLTESLLASQLFGHRRGAFTGALDDHKGFFETAHGGTLFLDEIGDVPMAVQTNLLRVLQEREILRVGDSQPRKVDVRVLVATHRNLAEEVAAGRFREDLLYRIRVARIRLPPLRERREDIPLLAEAFLAESRAASGKDVREIAPDAMALLLAYPWPGNVRELRSAVEFAVIRARGPKLTPSDLPPELVAPPQPPPAAPAAHTPEEERARIREALARAGGNRTRAARLLGIGRATLYRRMEALGMEPGDQG